MGTISQSMKTILASFVFLCCAENAQKQKTDKSVDDASKMRQVGRSHVLPQKQVASNASESKGAHESWLTNCQKQITYLEKYEDPAPRIEWSKKKKEEVLKRAIKYIYELVPNWTSPGRHSDNGTELVNIEIPSKTAPNKGFLLADGEIQTTLEWAKNGNPQKTALRSWTGTREGIRKKLKNKEDVICLTSFELKAWGRVQDKDVVVVIENTNVGEGCLQYQDQEWIFDGWSSYGMEPVYTIVIWEENGEWKSIIRSKKVFPLEKEEICQILGEEWGIISRKGPPPPLLIFDKDE